MGTGTYSFEREQEQEQQPQHRSGQQIAHFLMGARPSSLSSSKSKDGTATTSYTGTPVHITNTSGGSGAGSMNIESILQQQQAMQRKAMCTRPGTMGGLEQQHPYSTQGGGGFTLPGHREENEEDVLAEENAAGVQQLENGHGHYHHPPGYVNETFYPSNPSNPKNASAPHPPPVSSSVSNPSFLQKRAADVMAWRYGSGVDRPGRKATSFFSSGGIAPAAAVSTSTELHQPLLVPAAAAVPGGQYAPSVGDGGGSYGSFQGEEMSSSSSMELVTEESQNGMPVSVAFFQQQYGEMAAAAGSLRRSDVEAAAAAGTANLHLHQQQQHHHHHQHSQQYASRSVAVPPSTSSSYGIPQLGKSIMQLFKGGIGRVAAPTPAPYDKQGPLGHAIPPPAAAASLTSSTSSSSSSLSSLSPAGPALPLMGATTAEIDRLTGHRSQEVFGQMKRDELRHPVLYGLEPEEGLRQSFPPPTLEVLAFLRDGHRRKLVGWLASVGDTLKMRRATVHVAVAYLDRLFQRVVPPKEKWQMLAISCLQVAAKYEEAEENVPSVNQLSRASNISLTIQTVQRWEIAVLEGLEWQLTCIVPLHFVEFYLTRGVLFHGDTVAGGRQRLGGHAAASSSSSLSPDSAEQQVAPAQLRKHAHFFANYAVVQEFAALASYPASFVAALLLYLSRMALGVAPTWRPELTELTGVEEASLACLAYQLLRSFRQDYPQHLAAAAAAGVGLPQSSSSHHYASKHSSYHQAAAAVGPAGLGAFLPDPPPFDYHLIPRGVASV